MDKPKNKETKIISNFDKSGIFSFEEREIHSNSDGLGIFSFEEREIHSKSDGLGIFPSKDGNLDFLSRKEIFSGLVKEETSNVPLSKKSNEYEYKKTNEKCKSDTSDQIKSDNQIEPDDILQILANLSEMTNKIKECRDTIKFKYY